MIRRLKFIHPLITKKNSGKKTKKLLMDNSYWFMNNGKSMIGERCSVDVWWKEDIWLGETVKATHAEWKPGIGKPL